MSTKSLLAFVQNLHQDFKDADTNEKRMEYIRQLLVKKQRYRLRMYAYATL